MSEKISLYVNSIVKLPHNQSVVDVSQFLDPGFQTAKMEIGVLGLTMLLASGSIDTGSTGTTTLTWNCSGKSVTPTLLVIQNTAGGKAMGLIRIKIQKVGNDGDIMKTETLGGLFLDSTVVIPISGGLPEDTLVDSEDWEIEVENPSAGGSTQLMKIYGLNEDV